METIPPTPAIALPTENTLKTTKTTPKLHQIPQKTLLDHPRTRPKIFEFFDFFAPRTASTTSKLTSQSHLLRQFLKELHQKYPRKYTKNDENYTRNSPNYSKNTSRPPLNPIKNFRIFRFFISQNPLYDLQIDVSKSPRKAIC